MLQLVFIIDLVVSLVVNLVDLNSLDIKHFQYVG